MGRCVVRLSAAVPNDRGSVNVEILRRGFDEASTRLWKVLSWAPHHQKSGTEVDTLIDKFSYLSYIITNTNMVKAVGTCPSHRRGREIGKTPVKMLLVQSLRRTVASGRILSLHPR